MLGRAAVNLIPIKAFIRAGAIGLGGLVFLFGVSIKATAMPGHFVVPASRSVELHAKGSHGFGVNVSGNRQRSPREQHVHGSGLDW
jgi:hypothetical protein